MQNMMIYTYIALVEDSMTADMYEVQGISINSDRGSAGKAIRDLYEKQCYKINTLTIVDLQSVKAEETLIETSKELI